MLSTSCITTEVTKNSQRLKAALWYAIGKIVDEESLRLGVNATPQFIGALTEMVWTQTGIRFPRVLLYRLIEYRKCGTRPRELRETRWTINGDDGRCSSHYKEK